MKLIQKAYGDAALSRTTTFEWHKQFWEGRDSVNDDKRRGRPTSRNDDNIAAIDKMVKEDRKATSWLKAYTLGIPKTVVLRILREDLKKQKLCSRFVPRALTWQQMYEWVAACQDLLNMINGDKIFLDKVITGDESWRFAYDPETKRQSSERVGEHSPWPKKLRFQKSRVKKMLIVFFDSQGIVHKEFMQGCTVNAEYYKGALDCLILCIWQVCPALYHTGDFFLLHNNAPVHSAALIRQFLTQKQVATLNYPPILARTVSPQLLPVPEGEDAAEGCKIWYNWRDSESRGPAKRDFCRRLF